MSIKEKANTIKKVFHVGTELDTLMEMVEEKTIKDVIKLLKRNIKSSMGDYGSGDYQAILKDLIYQIQVELDKSYIEV